MLSNFSDLLRTGRLVVVDQLNIAEPKTKSAVALLKTLDAQKVLFIPDEITETLYLAVRNLFHVGLCDVFSLDPVSLIRFDKVVMTPESIRQLQEQFV